jgi:hypothetical protein
VEVGGDGAVSFLGEGSIRDFLTFSRKVRIQRL